MKNQDDYWDDASKLGPYASVIDCNDTKGIKNDYIKYIRDTILLGAFSNFDLSRKILDFGCGSGNICDLLSSQGIYIDGVDISKGMLKLASSRCDSDLCRFLHYDGENIPVNSEYYDGVVTYLVLGHITNQDHLLSLLRQIYDSMKPRGIFIAIEQTRFNTKITDEGYKLQRTRQLYQKIFRISGFNIQKTYDIRSGHFLFIYLIRIGFIRKKYFSLMSSLEKKIIRMIPTPLFDYRDTVFVLRKD